MIESLPVVFHKYETFPITKNNQIGTLKHLGLQFVITFELLFNRVPGNWYSVLHFTIGDNGGDYGERIPALWCYSNQWYLVSAISGRADNYKIISHNWQVNTWYRVEISQLLKDNGEVSKCLRIIYNI